MIHKKLETALTPCDIRVLRFLREVEGQPSLVELSELIQPCTAEEVHHSCGKLAGLGLVERYGKGLESTFSVTEEGYLAVDQFEEHTAKVPTVVRRGRRSQRPWQTD